MITHSDSIKAISKALLTVQGALDGVGKNSENPAFKRGNKAMKYANLEAVIDTAKPELQNAGVLFIQSGGAIVDGVMAMSTRLIHAESGEWIEGTMDIALGKRDPQGVGSALTYAQRYHLMAMLGLPPVDDDGEAAIDRNNARPAAIEGRAAPNATANMPMADDLQMPARGPLKSSAQAKKDGDWEELKTEIDACATLSQLNILVASKPFLDAVSPIPNQWKAALRDYIQTYREELTVNPPKAADPFGLDRLELTQAQKIAATP